MKTKLILFLLLLNNCFLSAQWSIVGGENSNFIPNPGFNNGQSQSVNQYLQFHPTTNEAYVFFKHTTTNDIAGPTLVKYNGTQWEYIATKFDDIVVLGDKAWGFYFREDTNLPVVFYQRSYYDQAILKKFYKVKQRTGTIWEEIIGVDNTTINDVFFGAEKTRMVAHPNSKLPVIPSKSPQINAYGHKTLVAQFSNSKWTNLGDANFSDVGANEVDIDFNKTTAIPYVITRYQDTNTFTPYVEVYKFEGSWTKLGETGFVPTNGDGFRVRVNQQDGSVYALCPENYNNPNNAQTKTLTVKKWNGTSWEKLGLSNELYPTSTLGYDMEIHPETGIPYVCFNDGNATNAGQINIRKWNGTNWVAANENNLIGTLGEKIDLVFQPQTNIPHVISSTGQLLKCIENGNTASTDDFNLHTIKIYPNPSSDKITVDANHIYSLTLYDINGKKLSSTNTKQLTTRYLPKGVYLLKITDTRQNSIIKRIVKE